MTKQAESVLQARHYLESRRDFCYSRPGGPESTKVRKSIMILLESDKGCECLEAFVDSSNWATVLYGLVGLYYAKPFEYQIILSRVRGKAKGATVNVTYDTDVEFANPQSVDGLLAVDDGYRLCYGETVSDHCGRKCVAIDERRVDFLGGGIPICFMDLGSSILVERNGSDNGDEVINVGSGRVLEYKAEFYGMWKACFERAVRRNR